MAFSASCNRVKSAVSASIPPDKPLVDYSSNVKAGSISVHHGPRSEANLRLSSFFRAVQLHYAAKIRKIDAVSQEGLRFAIQASG
jgi:hypothetical protein